jgi:hypothetical protein
MPVCHGFSLLVGRDYGRLPQHKRHT